MPNKSMRSAGNWDNCRGGPRLLHVEQHGEDGAEQQDENGAHDQIASASPRGQLGRR
ncbi:MAG: hypothetical protein RLY70_137 [Planctomycetota bacterium]